jgi:hypothetical protein
MPISLAGFTKSNSMKEMDMIGTLVRLADLGVTGIKVQYEGGGDSGAIEGVVYTIQKLHEDEESAFDLIDELYIWGTEAMKLEDLDSGLASDIEHFVEEKLLNDIEDWWNNDGGSGSVCIIVASGKYKIINDVRYTQTETYIHEGALVDKTL